MQHDSGLVGDFAVREGSRVALLLLVEDAVLGQQQVQEERGDRADRVRSLEQDDQRRAVRVLALIVVVTAAAVGSWRRFLAAPRIPASSLASEEQAPRPQAKRTRAIQDISRRELGGELADCKTLAKTA